MYYWGDYGSFWPTDPWSAPVDGPFHFIGFIGMIAFLALVIAGIVWLVRQTGTSGSQGSNSALEILKTRYAKGELTRDEFEKMKKDIGA